MNSLTGILVYYALTIPLALLAVQLIQSEPVLQTIVVGFSTGYATGRIIMKLVPDILV